MACHGSCGIGWRCMSVTMILEAAACLAASVLWGTGTVEDIINYIRGEVACNFSCVEELHDQVYPLNVAASVLYAGSSVSAVVAFLGLLSGYYHLQVHHVIVSFIRMVGTIVIGECLIPMKWDGNVFIYNRILLYVSSTINVICFALIYRQTSIEYQRFVEQEINNEEREVRPLTRFFACCFETMPARTIRSGAAGCDVVDGNRSARTTQQRLQENASLSDSQNCIVDVHADEHEDNKDLLDNNRQCDSNSESNVSADDKKECGNSREYEAQTSMDEEDSSLVK